MIFISENILDEVIDKFDNEENYLQALGSMMKEQPDLHAYLDPENFSLLTTEEMALLEYLCCIIYFGTKEGLSKYIILTGKKLEDFEEQNWDIFNSTGTKDFSKILDVFFKNYTQEDLLALVEDSIQPEDDNIVTPVGREIIFVACKSLIDALDKLN